MDTIRVAVEKESKPFSTLIFSDQASDQEILEIIAHIDGTDFKKLSFNEYVSNEGEYVLIEQPFSSWTWNENIFSWVAPKDKPETPGDYVWNESEQNWENIAI
jgi:hypothetical protein